MSDTSEKVFLKNQYTQKSTLSTFYDTSPICIKFQKETFYSNSYFKCKAFDTIF